jgi:hypothetical protein
MARPPEPIAIGVATHDRRPAPAGAGLRHPGRSSSHPARVRRDREGQRAPASVAEVRSVMSDAARRADGFLR